MKWKQFFTPVTSINWDQAEKLRLDNPENEIIYLDVRQPSEYGAGHFPGAKLIPVGELDKRLDELDPEDHIVIY